METLLCIPRMDASVPKQYILNTLYKLNWGYVSLINEIPLRNEPSHKRIMWRVRWNDTSREYRERIQDGECLKLVHDMKSPYFWKIVISKS
jgi:hypothetical protein